jgi:hypothetical protein
MSTKRASELKDVATIEITRGGNNMNTKRLFTRTGKEVGRFFGWILGVLVV